MPAPRPFTVAVPDAVLTDLRERPRRARFPDEPPGAGWQFGSELRVREGADHVLARALRLAALGGELNRLPQFTAPVAWHRRSLHS
jgi:hypothetical protein